MSCLIQSVLIALSGGDIEQLQNPADSCSGTAQPELSKPNDSMPIDFLSDVKRILIIPFKLWLIPTYLRNLGK